MVPFSSGPPLCMRFIAVFSFSHLLLPFRHPTCCGGSFAVNCLSVARGFPPLQVDRFRVPLSLRARATAELQLSATEQLSRGLRVDVWSRPHLWLPRSSTCLRFVCAYVNIGLCELRLRPVCRAAGNIDRVWEVGRFRSAEVGLLFPAFFSSIVVFLFEVAPDVYCRLCLTHKRSSG